ncbi:MAG: branched-chain amino acid ABC transporter permease [Clostridiales bacterium]|nr:branched-chain amino acid ABC transporter permease [Clostridiales bacterium]
MNNMKNSANNTTQAVEAEQRTSGSWGDIVDKLYELMDNKRIFYPTMLGILLLACLIPVFCNNYLIEIAWLAMFYMLLAMGLNVIVGYAGMFDFGYAAKFAVGAYTSGILVHTFGWNFWLTLPVTVITATIAACIIGGPTLRLRSDYLTIVTLGFGEITRIVARNLEITGSASGLSGIKRPYLFDLQLTKISYWFYVFLVLVILFVIISNRIKNSRFGRALEYIREDEDAAEAMGIDTVRYKLWAYIMGSILGGLAGSFYVMKMTAISPNSFQFLQSANIMLAVVFGGLGKIPGVMMGAVFFVVFPELFRPVAEYRMLFFGLLLVILMIFRPQGLWPERRR